MYQSKTLVVNNTGFGTDSESAGHTGPDYVEWLRLRADLAEAAAVQSTSTAVNGTATTVDPIESERPNRHKVVVYDLAVTYSNYYLHPCLVSFTSHWVQQAQGCEKFYDIKTKNKVAANSAT